MLQWEPEIPEIHNTVESNAKTDVPRECDGRAM